MTAKNRHRSSEKSAASSQDDAPKKTQANTSVSATVGPGSREPRSRSCISLFVSTVFYMALIGAAGFAAFYVQKVVEEMRQATATQEESARKNGEMATKLDNVVLQINGLRSVVDGLDSSVGITRAEMEGALSRMKKNELETRRVEEALQKLQNDLLRELSDGINEVKEARGRDFSSLESTVEERLAEVSQSITATLAEFTEAQGEAQNQLAELKAHLGDMEDPALIKQELSAIVDVVAELKTAKQASAVSAESLGEQIGAVRAELQTRNQEVVSLSQEVETVRSVMQETGGSLRQALSAAEASIQALKGKSETLENSVEQAANAVRHVEMRAEEAVAQAKRQADDLDARVKASEDSADSLTASVSDITSKVESLLAKYENTESTLASQEQAVEEAKTSMEREMEALKNGLGDLHSNVATLGETQAALTSKDSDLDELVKDLEERLTAVEGSSSEELDQLQSLRSSVAELEAKSAKLEDHEEAISALRRALQETTRTLAELPIVHEKKEE